MGVFLERFSQRLNLRLACEGQVATMAPAVRRYAAPARLVILMMLTTAARVGDVLNLTWSPIDCERGQSRLDEGRAWPGQIGQLCHWQGRAALERARHEALTNHVIAGDGLVCRIAVHGVPSWREIRTHPVAIGTGVVHARNRATGGHRNRRATEQLVPGSQPTICGKRRRYRIL